MPTWICPHCLDKENQLPKEFSSEVEYKKHMELHKGNTKSLEPPKIEPVIEPKKEAITLVYTYKGQCPNCGHSVETIPLDVDKSTKVIVIAWCPSCKEKRGQREVAKL